MENLWNNFLEELFSKESLIMLASIIISATLTIIIPAITDVVARIIRRRRKMKKGIFIFLVVVFIFSGCALYGNKAQYDSGDWYWVTGSEEVARIEQNKLALAKLEAQPTQTAIVNGVNQGYKGLVSNLYSRRVNIHLNGPEKKSYLLAAGQNEVDYLLPGEYIATAYRGGRFVGAWKFEVGAKQVSYMGQKVHWYVYYDP